ncbi:NAD(P)-dependent oxidoreductase [Mycolicibacterium parafortuitum]|uniref:NAD(P)-dependent oxidoreductase n=1 Tax=Mycolicibacterium parafortuitum TaxID=39692 RepID=UPI0013D4495E|nr:NAD(P)-binding domain-containing protein [Mycolicibacterium parafortuitum]
MSSVTFLGAGAMGSALAVAAVEAGYRTTVWNRTFCRSEALQGNGITVTRRIDDAMADADVVVVCLLDQVSVRDVLYPVAGALAGRHVINLTTTTPDGARDLARRAADAGISYLDGGIMATPEMIGTAESTLFYSGARAVFDTHRDLLEVWGTAEYFGTDAGMASLYDLALLAAMYTMFAGFFQGAAMLAPAGVSATEFAARAVPWLQALAPAVGEYAAVIDGGDYGVPGQQSLLFSDLGDISETARAQGVSSEIVDTVQRLIRRQVDAGRGADGFARVFESIRLPEDAA